MGDLKKNQFAITIGGILLVYGALYFFMLRPLYHGDQGILIYKDDLITNKGHLEKYEGKPGTIPSENLIKYHDNKKKKLEAETKDVLKFFEDKSNYLNGVFDEIAKKKQETGTVSLAYFQAVYANEVENFVKNYVNGTNKLEIRKKESGFEGSIDSIDGKPRSEEIKEILNFDNARSIVGATAQTDVQKKFWVIKYVLECLEQGKLNVLHQFVVRDPGSDAKGTFRKYTIELAGVIYYENISLLLQKILQSEKLLTEIKKVEVNRHEGYEVKTIEIPVIHDDRPDDVRYEEAKADYLKDNPVAPVPVDIKVEFQVWDYNKK